MLEFLVVVAVIVAVVAAWRWRVPLLARILGQPEERVRRRLEQRRD